MHLLSDEHIMSKVCTGQIEQLGLLFERYHVKLYNFFLRTTIDRDLSQDLTQSVFERILKYKHSYKDGASFKSWMYQIARNVRTDHFKKQKFTSSLEDAKVDKNIKFAESENLSMEKEEQIKQLYKALDKLSEDKREILVLSQLEEMEYTQIAQTLNITENTARVKVHRALKALREVFYV